MTSNQIALRISGTKERKAGFVPLVGAGVLPSAEEVGLDRAMTGCKGLGFVIKHTPNYSFYMAIDGNVRSFDASANGVLTIAIVIPKGLKIGDDKTPYNLLIEVYNYFVNDYMTESSDGRHVFQKVTPDTEPFKDILSRYPLEVSTLSRISMNPIGITGKLNVPTEKMQEFFEDSFYPEFETFKDIEVGDGLVTSAALNNIRIPRPVIYKIYVNDKYRDKIDSTNISVSIKPWDNSTIFYYYESCEFTLKELKENNGFLDKDGSEIILDEVNERIDCNLKRLSVRYKVKVKFGLNDNQHRLIKKWLQDGDLHLKIDDGNNYKDISREVVEDRLTLTYEEAQCAIFEITPDRIDKYRISISRKGDINTYSKEVNLTINIIKEAAVISKNEKNKSKKPEPSPEPDSHLASGNIYKNLSSASSNDSKIRLVFGLLVGLLIGSAIGFYVDRYVLHHNPTQEQIDNIRAKYRTELTESLTDSISKAMKKESLKDDLSPQGETASKNNTYSQQHTMKPEVVNSPSTPPNSFGETSTSAANTKVKQAVKLFNAPVNVPKFEDICKDPNLIKYKEDGTAILKILCTNSPLKRAALQTAGYLDKNNNRTDKSRIKSLDELKGLRSAIEATVNTE